MTATICPGNIIRYRLRNTSGITGIRLGRVVPGLCRKLRFQLLLRSNPGTGDDGTDASERLPDRSSERTSTGGHPPLYRGRNAQADEKSASRLHKKQVDAKSAAAAKGTQLSNRWVPSSQLRCVMVFDTQSKQFVGSGCYVIGSLPPAGTMAKFDTFSAEFVGAPTL